MTPQKHRLPQLRSCEKIGKHAGLADGSVCPTLTHQDLRLSGAGAFACEPIFSQPVLLVAHPCLRILSGQAGGLPYNEVCASCCSAVKAEWEKPASPRPPACSYRELGYSTLVMSVDPAHSLADAFDLESSLFQEKTNEPYPIDSHLSIQEVNIQKEIKRHWREISTYVVSVLRTTGISDVEAEELAILPGMEELSAMMYVNQFRREQNMTSSCWIARPPPSPCASSACPPRSNGT